MITHPDVNIAEEMGDICINSTRQDLNRGKLQKESGLNTSNGVIRTFMKNYTPD